MRRRTSRFVLPVALLALVGLTAACGDDANSIKISKGSSTTVQDAGNASSEDIAAFLAYFNGNDSLVDEEQGTCAAKASVADLSESGMGTIRAGGDFDLKAFGTDDAAVIVGALDTCVPLNSAVDAFATGVAGAEGLPISEEEATCASKEFAREYKGSGEFIEAVSTMSQDESGARLLTALGGCVTDEGAASFMSSVLATQGMDEATAQCVAEGLVGILGKEQMMAAIAESGSGGSTQELTDATTEAATACATGAGGAAVDPAAGVGGGISGNG